MPIDLFIKVVIAVELIAFRILGFIIGLNFIILLGHGIYQLLLKYAVSWKNLKSKFKELIQEFQEQDFSYYVDLINLLLIALALFLNINVYYIIVYLPIYLITKIFIWVVKDILLRQKTPLKITEFWFFIYVVLFSFIMLSYIFSFSLFYNDIFSLNYGYMSSDKDNYIRLNFVDTFLYSGFTFFSMEYKNFIPQRAFAWFTFAELFISQILLITFIGVMASKLIDKINLNILRNEKNK